MIKKILITLFVIILIVNNSYSQSYTYKKCLVGQGFSFFFHKMKGEIYITDTMITIISKRSRFAPKSKVQYPIKVTTKKENYLAARTSLNTQEDPIWFTLEENDLENKKEKYTLGISRQDFSIQKKTIIKYFLIPNDIK